MNDLSKREEIDRNEIAARLIARHIGYLQAAWLEIDALDRRYPNAPVGVDSWNVFRDVARRLNAMIKEWDREDG